MKRLGTAVLISLAAAFPVAASGFELQDLAFDELIAAHRSAQPGWATYRSASPDRSMLPDRGRNREDALRLASAALDTDCPALLRYEFTPIQGGGVQSMCQYHGKVLLVVNTATQCGYAYQYETLEGLYKKYRDRGLVVVGFPSNDFGGQEPRSNKEIEEFCRTVYGVQFPMFEKSSGSAKLSANPFYAELAAKAGEASKWNFHKYVIDRTGHKVTSFRSGVEPNSREFVALIERLLAEKPPVRAG